MPEPVIDVDPMDLYPALRRPKPQARPWLMINMIASADGAITVDGTSEALGNAADQAVFSAVRACADWILVAARTVRVERYGIPRPGSAASRARAAAGRLPRPRLAVVSAGLDLDVDLPLFAERRRGEEPPLVMTGQSAAAGAAARLEGVAEVVRLAPDRPAPAQILAELESRGASVVLCEGGASLNAQLLDADMIDELCLSVSPLLAGGPSTRLVHGSRLTVPRQLALAHLLEASDTLFARYLRTDSTAGASAA